MKTIRFSLFTALLLSLCTSAFAQVTCYTKPTNYPSTPYVYANNFWPGWRNNLDQDFADYGLIFEDAKKRDCSLWAKEALKTKIQQTNLYAIGRRHLHAGINPTLPIPENKKYEGLGPYQNWLEGAHVALASAAALAIGGHGDLTTELDQAVQAMIVNFNTLPNQNVTYPVPSYYRYGLNTTSGVGKRWRDDDPPAIAPIAADTAMDDHAVGANGHAWAAAYMHKRGNTYWRDININKAKAAINDSLGLTEANGHDSICLHDPMAGMSPAGRGPCNVTDPAQISVVLNRTDQNQRGYTFALNRHENNAYGFGLVASLSAASVGLEEAGTTWSLTANQKLLVQALLEEAQKKAKPGLSDGEYFNGELGGIGTCATFSVNASGQIVNPNNEKCADTAQRPRMYALVGAPDPPVAPNTFFSKYLAGYTPKTNVYDREKNTTIYNVFQFNRFVWSDFTKDFGDNSGRPHWARAVWFANLAYYWHTKVYDPNPDYYPPTPGELRPRLSGTLDNYNPIGYIDGIDSNGAAWGWTCDQDAPTKSIWIDFYQDNVPGVGTYLGQTRANWSSESAINSMCGGGTAHRFWIQLPASAKGHAIYPYGLDATWRGYTLLPSSTGCPGGICIYP